MYKTKDKKDPLTGNHRLSTKISIPPEILSRILHAIRPAKIICFGVRTQAAEAWSCFLPDMEREEAKAYDLLILTTPDEKRPTPALLDMATAFNTRLVQVNALIHNVATVKEAVSERQPFFTAVCTEGHLLYDAGNHPFEFPTEHLLSAESKRLTNEAHWVSGFGRAQKFLAGASHFHSRGWNGLSCFMLHQAIEQTCIALTQSVTGYRPNSHNLNRLTKMIDNYAPFSPPVFPRNTREEVRLFDILTRAYAEARYNNAHWVTSREISVLIDRVAAFLRHAENTHRKRDRKECQCSNN